MSAIVDFLSHLIASLISAALVHFGAIALAETNDHEANIDEAALIESHKGMADDSATSALCTSKSREAQDPLIADCPEQS